MQNSRIKKACSSLPQIEFLLSIWCRNRAFPDLNSDPKLVCDIHIQHESCCWKYPQKVLGQQQSNGLNGGQQLVSTTEISSCTYVCRAGEFSERSCEDSLHNKYVNNAASFTVCLTKSHLAISDIWKQWNPFTTATSSLSSWSVLSSSTGWSTLCVLHVRWIAKLVSLSKSALQKRYIWEVNMDS